MCRHVGLPTAPIRTQVSITSVCKVIVELCEGEGPRTEGHARSNYDKVPFSVSLIARVGAIALEPS